MNLEIAGNGYLKELSSNFTHLITLLAVFDDLAKHFAVVCGQLEAELVHADTLFGRGGLLILHLQFWPPFVAFPDFLYLSKERLSEFVYVSHGRL